MSSPAPRPSRAHSPTPGGRPGGLAPADRAAISDLLAVGDSITVGDGDPMPGLRCRPWVSWLAQDLGLDLVNLAANGAQVSDLLAEQLPRAPDHCALACLYIGVNDVRSIEFDRDAFTAGLQAAAGLLAARSDRMLMVTVPLDLGRPRAGPKVLDANRAIRRVAATHGATVLANDGRRGWQQVLPDAVHLTALGQRALADDALRALGASDLASPTGAGGGPPGRDRLGTVRTLRYAVTGHAPAVWHDLRRRAREGTLWS